MLRFDHMELTLRRAADTGARPPRADPGVEDFVVGAPTVRPLSVKYLLPVCFDLQCMEQTGRCPAGYVEGDASAAAQLAPETAPPGVTYLAEP